MDRFLDFTFSVAMVLFVTLFWMMVMAGAIIAVCVCLHFFGVFTCDTIMCG